MSTITPAGGRHATKTTSPEFQAEQAHFQQFKFAVHSLPRINSEAAARAYRTVLVSYIPTLAKSFRELGLDF